MGALPTGTVTFLFTDIEGSTKLVQKLGAGYGEILDAHCRIVRKAIENAGGTELGTEGDSFFAVFPSASAAVAATVAAQKDIADHPWPRGAEVRVRMGVHTGEGTRGGASYVGLDVHRAARIAAAGHGGQVLLSDATRSLVEGDLPGGVALRDLGAHRLKDLARPEHLYQLAVPNLPVDFPELRSLDAHPNNLPLQLTSFVGREEEIAAVGQLLETNRLVTLTGPGGTGKTRLALQVAAERLGRYGDGAFVVELAPITDPALVASAIAEVLAIREAADQPLVTTLAEALRDRDLLLVLDNFEQILDAAPLVTQLLAAAPKLRILVTSRAVLHVHGEREHPVPPLRVPDPAHLPTTEALSQFEGVALFVERAMSVRPGFAVDAATAPAIAEIVARLDGLPLAIELAAAKAKLLDAPAILGRLGSRLTFLGGGGRDLPARQQTLRQAIDWSYELLPASEAGLLRRLGVFVGGWTLDAAEAVVQPGELGLDTLDGIAALVDQSLVRRDEAAGNEPRFMMLETIREFALERLTAEGEVAELRTRHAEHFLALAEATEPQLTESPEAIDRIEHDHDNFRAALTWALETASAELGLRLGFALWRFWQQRGHLREGRDWLDRLLAMPGASEPTGARAKGLTGAAGIAYWQNDYPAAIGWYREAEEIVRGLDDPVWLADALYNTGTTAALIGDMATVMERLAEGIAIGRTLADDGIIGRYLAAQGYMAFMGGDYDAARAPLEEGLAIAERQGNQMAIGMGHHTVAQVARLQGRHADAVAHYGAALKMGREFGDTAALTEPLQGIAAVAVAAGDIERGVRLLGANEAIRERLGGGPPPEWIHLGDPFTPAREALGDEAYEKAWQAGRALSVEDAVDEALAVRVPSEVST